MPTDTPTPAGLTAARLAELADEFRRAVLDLEGRAFDFGECPIEDAAHYDSETEEARNRVLALFAEQAAALDAATAALAGAERQREALRELLAALDWWQDDEVGREFPADEIRAARETLAPARPTDAEARA